MSETEKGSGPWPIPRDWVWSTLGDVATVVGGGTPKTDVAEYWEPGEIPWLTPADLSDFDGMRIRAGSRYISRSGLDNSSAKLLPKGTVLFSSRAPIGYVAIADCPIATNQGFRSFVPGDEIIPEYLFYYLKGNTHLAVERARGTTFKEISGSNAARIPVPVPPKPVQAQIVEFISTYLTRLDAAGDSLDHADFRIDRYRASVLQAACEGRLVPTEAELARREGRDYEPADELLNRILAERRARWETEKLEKLKSKGKEPKDDRWKKQYKEPEGQDASELPELPEGWVWATIEQLCHVVTDGDHQAPPQVSSGIPFLVIGNVNDGQIDFRDTRYVPPEYHADLQPKRKPESGDVLLTVTGTLGVPVLVDTDEPFCVQRHIAILKPVSELDSRFLSEWLAVPAVQEQIASKATGTAQKTLGLRNLRKIVVPLPPQAEQVRILNRYAELDSIANHASSVVRTSDRRVAQLRSALLRQAFSGGGSESRVNADLAGTL